MVTVLHFEDRELVFALDSGMEGEGVDFSGEGSLEIISTTTME